MVNGSMGEAVGQMYVEKYFPAAYKERMLNLVHNLQTALGERMQSLTWMGDSTKVKALDKLRSFHVKIGYPDKWRETILPWMFLAIRFGKTERMWPNSIRIL
jgi:putative endopeptidase